MNSMKSGISKHLLSADRLRPAMDFLGSPAPARGAAFGLAGVALAFVVLVLERCRHGMDFTDEGMYLNYDSGPWNYAISLTQFGFVYHPIYTLVGGDIARLRQINVLITFGLATGLAHALLHWGRPRDRREIAADLALALCLAMPALLFLLYWLPTPGYNSLALQGLLLTTWGIVLASSLAPEEASPRRSGDFWPAIVIGAGGVAVFLAKPSSAALLAIVCAPVLWAIAARPVRTLAIAGGSAATLLLAATVLMDGSPLAFVRHLAESYQGYAELLASPKPTALLRWEGLRLTRSETWIFWLLAVASSAFLMLMRRHSRLASGIAVMIAAIAVVLLTVLMVNPDAFGMLRPPRFFEAAYLLAVPLALLASAVANDRGRSIGSRGGYRIAALTGYLCVCPYVFAFGTANVLSQHAMLAMVFLVAAGVPWAQASPDRNSALAATLALALVSVPVTAYLVMSSIENPYRLNSPLRQQTTPTPVGPGQSATLLVDPETARYFSELRSALAQDRASAYVPLIDLTGRNPGVLFGIGGKAIGSAWLIAGYPGSGALAGRALSGVPCEELARSWILMLPAGEKQLPLTILERSGLAVEPGRMVHIRRPPGGGEQLLVKPDPDGAAVVARCLNVRSQMQGANAGK